MTSTAGPPGAGTDGRTDPRAVAEDSGADRTVLELGDFFGAEFDGAAERTARVHPATTPPTAAMPAANITRRVTVIATTPSLCC
ncbi:MAG TPA: hypothetical protein VGH11_12230 [Jatrophihabitans sp.]|jgi:hypothetical protein